MPSYYHLSMITRRYLRIKVMQTLYSMDTLKAKSPEDTINNLSVGELYQRSRKALAEHFEQSAYLFAYFALTVTKVALYAEQDLKIRSGRYLKTQDDLNVNTKIAGNLIVWEILENPAFKQIISEGALEEKIDEDWIRKIYKQLTETPEYKEYIDQKERLIQQERFIIKFIWTQLLLASEDFNHFLTEEWTNWDDDFEVNLILLEHLLKNPSGFNFQKLSSKSKSDFANELLDVVLTKSEVLSNILLGRLKNWDPERVATVDAILLKMGIAEFLFFDSIPTKVTINEYIEIGKAYSTPQSGQFINGVLDSALRDLTSENKIHKTRR